MSAVEIRQYQDLRQFQKDAAAMAAAGWLVVSQAETTGKATASWLALGVIVIIASVLLFIPGILVGVLLLILGAVQRDKALVVTYRPA